MRNIQGLLEKEKRRLKNLAEENQKLQELHRLLK
jgi:hypothetical protein